MLGPEARPIWVGRTAGSYEGVPPRKFSLLPRGRPRNSDIYFPGRKLCGGPRRASVLRKRNRGKQKNDTRSFTPRTYPQRRKAYCDSGPRKPPGANPPLSDTGSKAAFFCPEEKSEPKKRLTANEDRLSSLRGKCPASHAAARHWSARKACPAPPRDAWEPKATPRRCSARRSRGSVTPAASAARSRFHRMGASRASPPPAPAARRESERSYTSATRSRTIGQDERTGREG